MRPASRLALFVALMSACLDNAGPEDFPAQAIEVVSAPAGSYMPAATLPEAIAVRVSDDRGNPAPGTPVAWRASSGGTLIPVSAVTDADGVSRAVWILGVPPGRQTATASTADRSVTLSVESAGWRVASISASKGSVTCAIDLAGDAYCWAELTGQAPKRVETAVRFAFLVTGDEFVCGLSVDRRVYCWGDNWGGHLGDGTTLARPVPAQVTLPPGDFRAVVAGGRSACAQAVEGTIYCWGRNDLGQLGRGFESDFETIPAPIPGTAGWRSVSMSDEDTCGVAGDGRVYCWGGGGASGLASPVALPALVEDLPRADTVAISTYARCALAQTQLFCWGRGTGYASPRPIAVGILSISASFKPIFGLGRDGRGYYWGSIGTTGWGFDHVVPFEADMRFSAVGGNDYFPYAIELETSTLYRWTEYSNFGIRPESGPTRPTPVSLPAD